MPCINCRNENCKGATRVEVCNLEEIATEIVTTVNVELDPIEVIINDDITITLPQVIPRGCNNTINGNTVVDCGEVAENCEDFVTPGNVVTALPVAIEGGLVDANLCLADVLVKTTANGQSTYGAIPVAVPYGQVLPVKIETNLGERNRDFILEGEILTLSPGTTTTTKTVPINSLLSDVDIYNDGTHPITVTMNGGATVGTSIVPPKGNFSYSAYPQDAPVSYITVSKYSADGATYDLYFNWKIYGDGFNNQVVSLFTLDQSILDGPDVLG